MRYWVVSLAILGLAAVHCGGSSEESKSENGAIEVEGVVVEVPNDVGMGIEVVETLPDLKTVQVIPRANVVLSSAATGQQNAITGDDGRFALSVPSLTGTDADYMLVFSKGHGGMRLTNLEPGAQALPLKAGKNLVLIRMIPASIVVVPDHPKGG